MEDLNRNTIEELIEIGPFSSLNETQKQIVVQEMTADEFDRLGKIMQGNAPFISKEKFMVEPNSNIEQILLEKMKSKKGGKSITKQIYIYGSSLAALLILLFLMNTYFFQEPVTTKPQPIVKVKNNNEPKQPSKNDKSIAIQPEQKEIEKVTENNVRKRSLVVTQTKKNQEPISAEDPGEFIFFTHEVIIEEVDDQGADLAKFSDESERAFHYYTQVN